MIEERGRCEKVQDKTRIIVTVIDTPGFGDSINNNDRFEPVEKYIVKQNELYEQNEVIRRPNNQEDDTRIHCCFYFIAPHRLTPNDCEFMRRLQSKAPIVPIVAKADTMDISERMTHLRQIHNFIHNESIKVFDFNEDGLDLTWLDETDEGVNFSSVGMWLSGCQIEPNALPQIPNVFAVISGTRRYMWGIASEEDTRHSDTQRLHKILFQDGSLGNLLQNCADIHEKWRTESHEKKTYAQCACCILTKNVYVQILMISFGGFVCLFLFKYMCLEEFLKKK